jgi:O-methyltransferase
VRQFLRQASKRVLGPFGYEITRIKSPWPADFQQPEIDLYREVAPYTMTSPSSVYVLAQAVRHVVANGIPGAIVECGVWKGGSMMAVARTLVELGHTTRDLYLFDTFDGMTAPTDKDVHRTGHTAKLMLSREPEKEGSVLWARAPLDQVGTAMSRIPYPGSMVHFVEGRVEDTIPDRAPDQISILRLDTDWYESTKHELVHLYPRLVPGGILILDDYGCWRGARRAADEYFEENGPLPLLLRIDDGGQRVAVKPNAEAARSSSIPFTPPTELGRDG